MFQHGRQTKLSHQTANRHFETLECEALGSVFERQNFGRVQDLNGGYTEREQPTEQDCVGVSLSRDQG